MVSVACGILTGILDAFFVGEFDKTWGEHFANENVKNIAKNKKIKDKLAQAENTAKAKGKVLSEETKQTIIDNIEKEFATTENLSENDILKKAISYLEKSKLPGDSIFSTKGNGITPSSHHLDDLAHHPTLAGFFCSIVMQFTHKGVYQNAAGRVMNVEIAETGVFGTDFLSKIFCGTVTWFYHLVSDVAGSRKTAGAGMGIPGPILSLAKEIAMIPGIRKTSLPKLLDNLFNKQRFNLRVELTIYHELGKQAIPVVINEVLVRCFYFIRHFAIEFKEKQSLANIDWNKVIPKKNRTIVRMMTIASGTFTVVDMADAAAETAIQKPGVCANPVTFFSSMILRVNFVGIGRFAIAVGTDVGMGVKKSRVRNERICLYTKQIALVDAKVFYKQADMWITAESAGETIEEAYTMMEKTTSLFVESMQEIADDLDKIAKYVPGINENNPGLIDDILNILNWG